MTLVAVLGGGQLGRMLGLAGIPLGLEFRFLDPTAGRAGRRGGRPRGRAARRRSRARGGGARRDRRHLRVGGRARGRGAVPRRPTVAVHPGARSLEVSQDRLVEKETFRRLGIATPAFAPVDDRAGLDAAVDAVGGLPAVLKTRRGGYDGKGQRVLRADVRRSTTRGPSSATCRCILEQLVPFDRELSVLAVRGLDGEVACWPLVENHHEGGILRVSRAPAPGLDAALQRRGEELAGRLLAELDHVGVLAVELFDVGGELLANEIAPRVHNSGHWTIEGAETSQFENHLRAMLGLPLGSTAARGPSAMLNCIGEMPDRDAVLVGARRPPPRLRQGAAAGAQARARHRHRAATTTSSAAPRSSRCRASGSA